MTLIQEIWAHLEVFAAGIFLAVCFRIIFEILILGLDATISRFLFTRLCLSLKSRYKDKHSGDQEAHPKEL